MWSDKTLKDSWDNLDDVAHRLRRGNTHYHNLVEMLATIQDLLQYVDRFRTRLDYLEQELRHLNTCPSRLDPHNTTKP